MLGRKREATPEAAPVPVEGRSADHIVPDQISETIRAAAERVRAGLQRELIGDGANAVAYARLELIVEALGSSAEAPPNPAGHSELTEFQTLHDLLYAEVMHGWATQGAPPPKDEMLWVVRSFQRVREAISRRPHEHFSLSPTPSDADLVLELAHDLRSPLTSIIFLAEALRGGHGGELNELQRRQLGIIYSAALGLVSMASDVIELGRGGFRLLEGHPLPLSVSELQGSTCDILMPVAMEKGLELRTVPLSVDWRLGHPVALSRVLLNLTANALRYTETGFVELSCVPVGGERVEFSVSDTGPGFDGDGAAKLFEPLRRNPVNNRFGFSGSGLGLAICRRLVRAMGGELQYESARGRGTRFYFQVELPPLPLP